MLFRFNQMIVTSCFFVLFSCGGGNDDSPSRSSSLASSIISSATSSSTSSISVASSSVTTSSASSSTTSVSSSSQVALATPQNLSVALGNGSVTLSWNAVAGAIGYHVYHATEANIQSKSINTFDNGTWVQNVASPYIVSGLENNKTYYFVVTATNGSLESLQSVEVSATPSAVDLAKLPNAQEVLVIELINRARFDPAAEAARYGIGLNEGITGTQITTDRKRPLAPNVFLVDAARTHSQWMLDNNTFSHDGANGNSPMDRMVAAGYIFSGSWTNGENIAWSGTSQTITNPTPFAVDHHEGLFKSPGHRRNILATGFREVGAGQKIGNFTSNGTVWKSSMLTENFARSGNNYFLTGVIYNDTNDNEFYDVGEGIGDVTITADGKSYPVYSTGSYAIPLGNGVYDVAITGTALGSVVNQRIEINNGNVKLDVIKNGSTNTVSSW